ncbi:arsenic resistance protein [Chloroflexota bacterium]
MVTLVVLFTYEGYLIIELPAIIGMIAIGILVNILVVFGATYIAGRVIHLSYEDASPAAIIAGSNHFEVAIARTLFGVTSGAALATVVGVLTEVPFMLILVQLCKAAKGTFRR